MSSNYSKLSLPLRKLCVALLFTENESSRAKGAIGLRYELVNSAPIQRSGTFIALCEPSAEVPKVRNAGTMTWPPEGVTRKMASPR